MPPTAPRLLGLPAELEFELYDGLELMPLYEPGYRPRCGLTVGSAGEGVPLVVPRLDSGLPAVPEGALKLVVAPGYVGDEGPVEDFAATPLAPGVPVAAGLATCEDGLGGYSGFAVAEAVLPANGFDFQNAWLLLPLDWQPARPTNAIMANANRARWIPMVTTSLWKRGIKKGEKP